MTKQQQKAWNSRVKVNNDLKTSSQSLITTYTDWHTSSKKCVVFFVFLVFIVQLRLDEEIKVQARVEISKDLCRIRRSESTVAASICFAKVVEAVLPIAGWLEYWRSNSASL